MNTTGSIEIDRPITKVFPDTFEDHGDRTRVTQDSTITPKGSTNIFFLLCSWIWKKSSCRVLHEELANLKRLLETRPTTPDS